MDSTNNDPIGQAIQDFSKNEHDDDIIVSSDICDDDVIPVEMLFRNYSEMPELEKVALSLCSGKVLDVGAAAGAHSKHLQSEGIDVGAIDISQGSVEYMLSQEINARKCDFFELKSGDFDTLLFLMNGIGIAGSLANLDATLIHAKKIVQPKGKILCDSTDIKYLYADENGGMWVDLSADYYGDFRFQMRYKDQVSAPFDWLYVDFDNLREAAQRTGWKAVKQYADGDHYLAELTLL